MTGRGVLLGLTIPVASPPAPDRADGDDRSPSRVLRAAQLLRQVTTARSPRVERLALALAATLFAIALAAGLAALPRAEGGFRYGWLAVIAGFVPVAVLANAAEYRVTAAIAGHRPTWSNSSRVAVLASAFNLLPMPGAVLVRMRAMLQAGSSTGAATISTALVGLGFVAVSLVTAGVLLVVAGDRLPLGAATAAGGIAGGAVVIGVLRRRTDRPGMLAAEIAAVELLSFAVKAVRIYAAARAIGFEITAAQSAGLAVAAVAALALGFFPAGLGIREVLSAAIAPVIGVEAAVGAVAASIDRVVGLAILGLMAAGLTLGRQPGTSPGAPEP